ncbi:MAG: hypothetical protein AAFW75_15540 [Cyanobacteria bacterium J06636_16]
MRDGYGYSPFAHPTEATEALEAQTHHSDRVLSFTAIAQSIPTKI